MGRIRPTLCAVALAIALSTPTGCADANDPAPAAAPTPTAKAKIPLDVTADESAGDVGETVAVEIEIRALADAEHVVADVSAGRGLEVVAGAGRYDIGRLAAGEVFVVAVDVRPAAPGYAYVNVHAGGRFGELDASAGYAIAVAVGGGSGAGLLGSEPLTIDDQGQLLRELPAEPR